MKYLICTMFVFLMSCSSAQTIRQLDTEIDTKGQTQDGIIGLKDGQALIQKQEFADQELRTQEWSNYALEDKVKGEYYWVKRCREEIADSRLGGNGEVTELPEIDNLKTPDGIKEEIGLADNKALKIVKTQNYIEKLNIERKYQTALETTLKILEKNRSGCERKMGQARLKAGLPSQRIQGDHTITPEGNVGVVMRKHENSLDDAFEISHKGRAPASRQAATQGDSSDE